jgi:Mce-associated membrane protein
MPSAMPPRRRPGQTPPPARKPRVAGIRRPEPPTGQEDRTETFPAIPAEPSAPAPVAAEQSAAEPVAEQPDRPAPTGKRRPRPTRRPTSAEDTLVGDTAIEPFTEPAPEAAPELTIPESAARRPALLVPITLGVVAVLIGGLAAWFGVQWSHTRGDATNMALTDNATTSEVSGQVTSAVNTVFSYNYADLSKSQQAVHKVLTGLALCQYDSLFKEIQQQAPKQKLVLTATVIDHGVELLQGDSARVLMLVQQHDTRATTNQSSDAESVIAVNAVRQGGDWRISAFDTFTNDNPTTCKS